MTGELQPSWASCVSVVLVQRASFSGGVFASQQPSQLASQACCAASLQLWAVALVLFVPSSWVLSHPPAAPSLLGLPALLRVSGSPSPALPLWQRPCAPASQPATVTGPSLLYFSCCFCEFFQPRRVIDCFQPPSDQTWLFLPASQARDGA